MSYSQTIWNTELVNETLEKLRYGSPVNMECFYLRDPELKAANILFQLTHEEEKEFNKCSGDIIHFVETYCKFMTDKGRDTVTLRDYQEDILKTVGEEEWIEELGDFGPKNRNFILMSARQSGKCQTFNTNIIIKNNKNLNISKIKIGDLYNIVNKSIKKKGKYKLFFRIKTFLYKIYDKFIMDNKEKYVEIISDILKKIIIFLIYTTEKYEYKHVNLSNKIIDSISLENLEIETDTGFKPISHIHKTKPFEIYKIVLENGMFLECADEHIVFNSLMNQIYIKDLRVGYFVQTDNGLQKIISIEKLSNNPVSMFDVTVNSNDHRFYSNGILSHNTTTIAAFFAWYLCFHIDRNLAILGNKQITAIEIVSKVMQVFKGLPFFLKPGIINAGALGMKLDNGCMLSSQATTGTAQIGFTIHVLYLDEFAHIRPNITEEFWRSAYPTLSSSRVSQCIITSTPNGKDNLFFDIWDKAVRGINSFKYKRVDYWQIPDHDNKWADQLKKDFGEEFFAQEFELKFDVKQNSLLDASDLYWISKLSTVYDYEFKELEKTKLDSELYENLIWRTDFDPNKDFDEKEDRFVISIDIAEGKDEDEKKDNDFNVANIHQIKLKSLSKLKKLRRDQHNISNMFRIEQVGVYRDRIKDEDILAKVSKAIVFDQFNPDIVKLLVEMNFNGKAYLKEFINHENFFEDIVLHTYHTKPVPGEKAPRKKPGFKQSSDKDYFCKLGKRLIKEKTLIPSEEETISEFGSFGKIKNAWKGIAKHDDLVMSEINISRLYNEQEYSDWLYDFFELLPDSREKKYAAELLKEPYEEKDIDDNTWNSMYGENELNTNISDIFKQEELNRNRYRPGTTFSK